MSNRVFSTHLNTIGQTYFGHQRVAFGYAAPLLGAGLAAAVHGIFPWLFETTVSRTITRLHGRMTGRVDAHQAGIAPPPG